MEEIDLDASFDDDDNDVVTDDFMPDMEGDMSDRLDEDELEDSMLSESDFDDDYDFDSDSDSSAAIDDGLDEYDF